ncbi:hypothetical protein [Streptomyces sp. NPDC058989]|uniref:hypothetical protein n=1 Tax=Streptomyces sp. NPDC058989 TaxID=3346686 RepID=UPI0036B34D13
MAVAAVVTVVPVAAAVLTIAVTTLVTTVVVAAVTTLVTTVIPAIVTALVTTVIPTVVPAIVTTAVAAVVTAVVAAVPVAVVAAVTVTVVVAGGGTTRGVVLHDHGICGWSRDCKDRRDGGRSEQCASSAHEDMFLSARLRRLTLCRHIGIAVAT